MMDINIIQDKTNKRSIGSLSATDWLNNIKENKIVINGVEKNIISSQRLLRELHELGYIKKLKRKRGYIPDEKYYKKKYFEDFTFDVKDDKGAIRKTTHTIYFTRKGQKKLLKLVLKMIKETIKQ